MKRRVPECKINWCCPYRSDLCKISEGGCTGEREPKNDFMIVQGDFVFVRDREIGDEFVFDRTGDHYRMRIPERTKEFFRKFDQGEGPEELVGEIRFEAP